MQKIFTVYYSSDVSEVNNFMGETGWIISVTPQKVGGQGERGHLLIVADDGKSKKEEELLP